MYQRDTPVVVGLVEPVEQVPAVQNVPESSDAVVLVGRADNSYDDEHNLLVKESLRGLERSAQQVMFGITLCHTTALERNCGHR